MFSVINLFFVLAICAATGLILVRNPVHSILLFVFTILNLSAILIVMGLEFLALTLLVVYVGAIAVLFLFVVMMLNIKVIELNEVF